MTARLFELPVIDQSFPTGSPKYITRAIVGFGSSSSARASLISGGGGASGVSGQLGLGLYGEHLGTVWAMGMTSTAGLETGGSNSRDVTTAFYGQNAGNSSVLQGRMDVVDKGCGVIDIAADDQSTLMGLVSIGGKTMQVHSGSFQLTGAGTQAITGVGFRPDIVLFAGAEHNFFGDPLANIQPGGLMFGAATPTQQLAFLNTTYYLQSLSTARLCQSESGLCIVTAVSSYTEGTLTSMDSDGFTLSFSGASNARIGYLALADPAGQFSMGIGTQGDTSFSPGFAPDVVLFVSASNTALHSQQHRAVFSFGAVDSTLAQFSGFGGGDAASQHARYWDAKALALAKFTSPIAVNGLATVTALGPTSTLSWSANDGTTQKFGWVALKFSAGQGYLGCGGRPPQIYRRVRGGR